MADESKLDGIMTAIKGLNVLELSDGWGHLKFGTNWDGNQHAYDVAVDLAKVT